MAGIADRAKLKRKLLAQGMTRYQVERSVGKTKPKKRGAKKTLTGEREKHRHEVMWRLQQKSRGLHAVTAERLWQAWKSKACSLRTLRRRIQRNYK